MGESEKSTTNNMHLKLPRANNDARSPNKLPQIRRIGLTRAQTEPIDLKQDDCNFPASPHGMKSPRDLTKQCLASPRINLSPKTTPSPSASPHFVEVPVDALIRFIKNNCTFGNDPDNTINAFHNLIKYFDVDNINVMPKDSCTILYAAVESGITTIVQRLLQIDGINLSGVQSSSKFTILHIATIKGYVEILKLLLLKGAKPEKCGDFFLFPWDLLKLPVCPKDRTVKETLQELWNSFNKGGDWCGKTKRRESRPLITKDAIFNEEGKLDFATLRKIITYLTTDEVNLRTKINPRHLFLTLRIFDFTVKDLFLAIKDRYDILQKTNDYQKPRIIELLSLWIKEFWADIKSSKGISKDFSSFVKSMEDNSTERYSILYSIQKANEMPPFSLKLIQIPTNPNLPVNPSIWTSYDMLKIAQCLHAIDEGLWRETNPVHCWSNNSLERVSDRWNYIQSWGQTEILMVNGLENIFKRIENIIDIMVALVFMNNFLSSHSLYVCTDRILSGKAKILMSGINQSYQCKMNSLHDLFGNLNYVPIQNKLKEILQSSPTSVAVPLPNLISKYRASLSEAKGLQTTGKSSLIKVSLMQNLAVTLDCIYRLHQTNYAPPELNPDLNDYLLNVKTLKDDETYALYSRFSDINFLNEQACYAAIHGHTLTLSKLIEYKIDINALDVDGRAPLHNAAMYSQGESIRILLSCPYIEPDIITRDSKETSLHIASLNGDETGVSLLLTYGCSTLKLLDKNNQLPEYRAVGKARKVWQMWNSIGDKKRARALLSQHYPIFNVSEIPYSARHSEKNNNIVYVAMHIVDNNGTIDESKHYFPECSALDLIHQGDCCRIYSKYKQALLFYRAALTKGQLKYEYLANFGIAKVYYEGGKTTLAIQYFTKVNEQILELRDVNFLIAVETLKILKELRVERKYS